MNDVASDQPVGEVSIPVAATGKRAVGIHQFVGRPAFVARAIGFDADTDDMMPINGNWEIVLANAVLIGEAAQRSVNGEHAESIRTGAADSVTTALVDRQFYAECAIWRQMLSSNEPLELR